jgi:hypothetical protein
MPKKCHREEFHNIDIDKMFYSELKQITKLKMYEHFIKNGWNTQLAVETRETLIPEIIRAIALGWASSIELAKKGEQDAKKR